MKSLLLAVALLASAGATAQKLPPANPVPFEEANTTAVMAPINAIFAAIAVGDAAAMLKHVYPDGRVTATGMRASGVSGIRSQSWTEFAKRITPEGSFEERITDPAIEIDGDIAMVWARFVVRRQGKVANCGFDHFDLIRENGVWKVMNLSFSSRITDCGE
jgi:ketosteroid isomerase-like protein